MTSVNSNVSDFNADFFILDQENKPADAVQFLKGLDALALRAIDALSKPQDVEQAFQQIERVNLSGLRSEDKTNVDQRMQEIFKNWVNVRFGSHTRHLPRKRLAEQCGPKFKAQYTSRMKEATDRELDLQSGNTSSTDSCPEECKEHLLVYLQTGTLPHGTLGVNALSMLVLAEQHQLEGLIAECLDFLTVNLSHENLDTFFEFTQQTYCPRLELACLNFMKDNRDSIPEEFKTKYQAKLSVVEALAGGAITLMVSSSGKIEAKVETLTEQTADSLQKINRQFLITSLILPMGTQHNLFDCLKQIAPTLKSLQELVIWNKTPSDSDLPELKSLFPNLEALGNDAPFLNTFDEVKTYVKNFKEPQTEDQESKKLLLRSLNLWAVSNLTDAQLAELTPYLQELYHLFIKSDKITSVVAPKATSVHCRRCTLLTTLEAPEATEVWCNGCTKLTTLEAPKATMVFCENCTRLTTLEVPQATEVYCMKCTSLATLEAPEAAWVNCRGCTALITLKAPEATKVYCNGLTKLTTLKAPEADLIDCDGCTQLTTLDAPKATYVYCKGCTLLTTLKAPEATQIDSRGCTQLKTLEVPAATYFVGNSKFIHLTKMYISSLWAFLAKALQSFLSLFDSLKSYLQNRRLTS